MKEIEVSFKIRIPLERTDVHWVEEELLRVRQEVFLEVFKRVIEEIEGQELKQAFGEEKKDKDVVEAFKALALEEKVKEILQRLMVEGSRARGFEEGEKIVEAMSYVKNNLDWIPNIAKVQGYGTGPVEKTVDIAVARRFKR